MTPADIETALTTATLWTAAALTPAAILAILLWLKPFNRKPSDPKLEVLRAFEAAHERYQDAKRRGDTRAMGEAFAPLKGAKTAQLRSELGL